MTGLLAFALSALALVSPKDGETVSLLTENQRTFLDMSFSNRVVATRAWDKSLRRDKTAWAEAKKTSYSLKAAPEPLLLNWSGATGRVDVAVTRVADGKVFFATNTADASASVWNLEIGVEYAWRVTGNGESRRATFRTDPQPPRLINGGKVANFRDLGGWKGLDGRRVRQGRLFRSAEANRHGTLASYVEASNADVFSDLIGLKTDLDLRNEKETSGMTASPFGKDVAWKLCPISPYYLVDAKRRDVFEPILDPLRHPVVFHCAAGKDRTATVALLTLALLGVSEDDIWRDYQMTARSLLPNGFGQLVKALREKFPSATLAGSAALYFRSLGFTDADIARFRAACLESPADQVDTRLGWDDHYALWDAEKTLFPLMTLVDPETVAETSTPSPRDSPGRDAARCVTSRAASTRSDSQSANRLWYNNPNERRK